MNRLYVLYVKQTNSFIFPSLHKMKGKSFPQYVFFTFTLVWQFFRIVTSIENSNQFLYYLCWADRVLSCFLKTRENHYSVDGLLLSNKSPPLLPVLFELVRSVSQKYSLPFITLSLLFNQYMFYSRFYLAQIFLIICDLPESFFNTSIKELCFFVIIFPFCFALVFFNHFHLFYPILFLVKMFSVNSSIINSFISRIFSIFSKRWQHRFCFGASFSLCYYW